MSATKNKIIERQTEIEDKGMNWTKICLFAEGTTTNGTSLIKFKRGAFEGMKTVQPCFIKIAERMVQPTWEVTHFAANLTLVISSLCLNHVTVYIMPEFTPTQKMLDMHKSKGSEDWEIFAECLREAMAKTGNFKINNQQIREKLEYERYLAGETD